VEGRDPDDKWPKPAWTDSTMPDKSRLAHHQINAGTRRTIQPTSDRERIRWSSGLGSSKRPSHARRRTIQEIPRRRPAIPRSPWTRPTTASNMVDDKWRPVRHARSNEVERAVQGRKRPPSNAKQSQEPRPTTAQAARLEQEPAGQNRESIATGDSPRRGGERGLSLAATRAAGGPVSAAGGSRLKITFPCRELSKLPQVVSSVAQNGRVRYRRKGKGVVDQATHRPERTGWPGMSDNGSVTWSGGLGS